MKAERNSDSMREAFHERMHGKGQYWNAQEKLFEVYCKKLGFNEQRVGDDNLEKTHTFRRPGAQAVLFE